MVGRPGASDKRGLTPVRRRPRRPVPLRRRTAPRRRPRGPRPSPDARVVPQPSADRASRLPEPLRRWCRPTPMRTRDPSA
ncbi:MAG: hypothetical protein E6G43_05645 [Actinobacteria bacterium]|nr:MAG: hypothetical protein E6G43_05645 [Actinomycetota bacterium]